MCERETDAESQTEAEAARVTNEENKGGSQKEKERMKGT